MFLMAFEYSSVNQTESAISFSLVYSLLSNVLAFQNFFIFSAADVMQCSGRKKSPSTSL